MHITRDIAESYGRDTVLKTALEELIIFLVFVTIITVYSLCDRTTTRFYLNTALKNEIILKSYDNIGSEETFDLSAIRTFLDIYQWLEQAFIPILYDGRTQDGKTLILDFNLLLGVGRIRQVRVYNNSCKVSKYFKNDLKECYAPYSGYYEDTNPYGLKEPTGWVYSDSSVTKSTVKYGQFGSYKGGGYYWDFPVDKKRTVELIRKLKNNKWIDWATRAIMIDFVVYNVNLNLFAICKIMFETPASGGVIHNYNFHTIELFRLMEVNDYFRLIFEFFMHGYIIIFCVEEFRDLKFFKWRYFLSFWSWIDLTIIASSLVIGSTSIYIFIQHTVLINEFLKHPNLYGNFEYLGTVHKISNYFESFMLFFAYLKLFKYLNINRSLSQLQDTLKKCRREIVAFTILFFIVFGAFALLGYQFFGRQVLKYQSFSISMFTLLRTILGDFDYDEIKEADAILAPLFFIVFIFIVFFILLNMFLAIIGDAYSLVKTELSLSVPEMQMSDYIKPKILKLLKKLKINLKKEEPQSDDFNITLQKITDGLKRCNFTDVELEMFFTRYNIDGTSKIENLDIDFLLSQLENPIESPIKHTKHEAGFIKSEDFERQKLLLEEAEKTVQKIKEQMTRMEAAMKRKSEKKRNKS